MKSDPQPDCHVAAQSDQAQRTARTGFIFPCVLIVCAIGCASRQSNPISADGHAPLPAIADWGPAYQPGMELGPPSLHLNRACHRAEAFLARQTFASQYAKRACSVGGGRFVDVNFALLSDGTGKSFGTVRVDTISGECVWVGASKL